KKIKTCPDAYAIFETEASRDAAVEAAEASGGVEFHGNTLRLNASRVEPQTVQWKNCANTDLVVKAKRIAMGMCIMFAGLALWVVAFYLPYAWFTLTFNYSYGQEPGFVAGMTFSMVVVAGNALMYLVCSEVADRTRFIYIDDREVCYMLLYCFACVFNVALDLITTYMVAYRVNVGLRMKTYDGTLLSNLQSFSDRFESYAMQRTLANNLYAYAFPATFLIPFLIEPIATIYAPYKIMVMIVRTQPHIKGFMAENLLGGLVFDLSRYADLMLDAMIAVLIFFFPGGFNIQMFLGMALSHVYIYAFDHYRVLRSIQCCNYTDKMVDWWSQWLMAIPCGCMLACFVFKANCQPGYFCMEGDEMVTACSLAFFAHIFLHTLLLKFVVPKFGLTGDSDGADTNTYKECSQRLACSWFTANPVYCLRSQYVYKHSPPCTYYLPGKEHLIEKNEEIGLYFQDCPAKEE
ncbi:DIMT1, partial [Symbiodinium pilosum]